MRRLAPYWIAVGLLFCLIAAKFDAQAGFTGLARFGEAWREKRLTALRGLPVATVPDSAGYDGQFYSQLALAPLLDEPELDYALDAPAYRARRILVPATAALVGLGNTWWTLQIYCLLNFACWIGLAFVLRGQIAGTDWETFARWFGCMFSMGVLESVRQSLVDLPALLLLFLAARKHPTSSSWTWLMLGNLAKESNVLGALAIGARPGSQDFSWARLLALLAIIAAPLAAWSIYVEWRFRGAPASTGLGNLTWPVWGLFHQSWTCIREILHGNWDSRFTFGILAVISLGAQAFIIWRTPQPDRAWWRIGAMYSILLVCLGTWVWSGYWATCRAVLPLTVAFNLLLPSSNRFWVWWCVGNITSLHALWRFL